VGLKLKEFTVSTTDEKTMNGSAFGLEGDAPALQQERSASSARTLRRELFSDELVDRLLDRIDEGDLALTGGGGFLPEMLQSVLERGMQRELSAHLRYGHRDPPGNGSGNSRNGTTPKTVDTEAGPVRLDQPRDRNSTFASRIVPKGERRMDGLDGMRSACTRAG